MFDKTFAIFLGENSSSTAAGFVVENGLFCALEIEEKEAENKIRLITEKIRGSLLASSINNLKQFTEFAQSIVNAHSLVSFSAGWLYESQLFFYTHNAVILLNRYNSLYKIVSGSETIQGNYNALDNYFFVTQSLANSFKISQLQHILKTETEPKLIVDKLKKEVGNNVRGVFLVIQTTKPKNIEDSQPLEPSSIDEPIFETETNYSESKQIKKRSGFLTQSNLKNKYKYIKIVVLALLLFFVLFQIFIGINNIIKKRRSENYNQEIILVEQEINKVSSSLLNSPSQGLQKLNTLKQNIIEIEKKYPDFNNKTKTLKKQVIQLQKNYGSAQISKDKLFFDLNLINKNAQIDYADITENYITVIDKKNKAAYLINIESKENSSFSLKKISNPILITEYNKDVYVFSQNKSVFQSVEGELVKQISADKELGKVVDLKVFNKNVYLLDSVKDSIYKYTPIEGGYGSKTSYFQTGQGADLANAKNMAIDFSVYILSNNNLLKYTGGNSETLLVKNLEISKITRVYKNPANNYIYLLDNSTARIIAINENGRIIKSVFNPKLKKVEYFGVYKDELIIFISQNKIYVLDNF